MEWQVQFQGIVLEVQNLDACGLPVERDAKCGNVVFFPHLIEFFVFWVVCIYQFHSGLERLAAKSYRRFLGEAFIAKMGYHGQQFAFSVFVAALKV